MTQQEVSNFVAQAAAQFGALTTSGTFAQIASGEFGNEVDLQNTQEMFEAGDQAYIDPTVVNRVGNLTRTNRTGQQFVSAVAQVALKKRDGSTGVWYFNPKAFLRTATKVNIPENSAICIDCGQVHNDGDFYDLFLTQYRQTKNYKQALQNVANELVTRNAHVEISNIRRVPTMGFVQDGNGNWQPSMKASDANTRSTFATYSIVNN